MPRRISADEVCMAMSRSLAYSDDVSKPMPFSMAFQPIVNVETGNVYAYEALVRGPNGEGATTVLSQLTAANSCSFDQSCCVEAIRLASRLGLVETGAALSINFLPNAAQSPSACVHQSLRAAREFNFPLNRLIFEVSECEQVRDPKHLQAIAREYHRNGCQIAIDDFGAGFANLNLLAELECSIVKLDMALVHNLHRRPRSETIVRSSIRLLQELGATVIAEGVETIQEYRLLRDCGIQLMQGYLLARPSFEALPPITIPVTSASRMRPEREQAVGFPMFPALAFAARA